MKHFFAIAAAICIATPADAQEVSQQADSFANIYATTCLRHLSDLDALRTKLASLPTLPSDRAVHFLQGQPGKAWPVPDKHGVFVLAIPNGKNLCAVFARRLSSPEAIMRFQRLVASAPAPLTARQLASTSSEARGRGTTHTTAYEWTSPGAKRRLLFTLTTDSSPSADVQGMASAAYVQ